MLHRAHHGPEYEGDWAWTPPAGARLPGEPIDACARRELLEETGLVRDLTPTECGTSEWPVYTVQVEPDTVVTLDDEHDRFEWVPSSAAVTRCRPDRALLPLQAAVRLLHSLR
jgi:8-oxo-dGTP pyrophosphatase MutT (NUDIX family)